MRPANALPVSIGIVVVEIIAAVIEIAIIIVAIKVVIVEVLLIVVLVVVNIVVVIDVLVILIIVLVYDFLSCARRTGISQQILTTRSETILTSGKFVNLMLEQHSS